MHEVNSPLKVAVSGKPAQVVNAIGWPEAAGVYRVDFVVPDRTLHGMAGVQLSAAWIPAPEHEFSVR